MRRAAGLFLVLSFLAPAIAPAAAKPKPSEAATSAAVAAFDRLAETARTDWGVPGLAVVVVKDGRTLLAKGYGWKEQGRMDVVDADTRFAAASTTKAMTAAAIGMLVDEGKLGWDDPLRRYIPELQLADAALADSLTVRDLLTHHTGLPETDSLWYTQDLDWKGVLGRLQKVGPSAPVRSRFEYQNVMYGLAGDLVERVSGVSWAEFVRGRIFRPLAMARTVPLGAEAVAEPNRVVPHSREDGSLAAFDTIAAVDPIPAAGSVWITAQDEAKWMNFLLDPTKPVDAGGKPLLQPATVEELFRPQVVIQPGGFYPTAEKTKPHWTTYGLGWFQQDYAGRKIDFHTGSIDGLVAIVGLQRESRFGVAVFANLDHAELRHALMFSAFDLFLDGQLARDWNRELREMYDGLRDKAATAQKEEEAKRIPNAPPSHPLATYAGRYTDPLIGSLVVSIAEGVLRADLGPFLHGALEPWHHDTFRLVWNRKLDGTWWANFRLGTDGQIEAVEILGKTLRREAEAPVETVKN